jgi:hypothetical protein
MITHLSWQVATAKKNPQFHVAIERIIREVSTGYHDAVVDHSAFGVEFAWPTGLIPGSLV